MAETIIEPYFERLAMSDEHPDGDGHVRNVAEQSTA